MDVETKETLNTILENIHQAIDEEDDEMLEDAFKNVPETFWEDSACFSPIMCAFFDGVGYEWYFYPVDFIPKCFWEDESNVYSYVALLSDYYYQERIQYNLCELMPLELLENVEIAKLMLKCNVDETLGYVSNDLLSSPEIALSALEGVQNKIEYRENNSTSWLPPFDVRECLEEFFANIPKTLASNKDFILDFLNYDYFNCDFDLLYDWIDQALWSDKEFVFEVLSANTDAIECVSDDLLSDQDFVQKIKEELNIDLD